MDGILGAMSPQMLRMMFASRSAQEQGYEMVLGMLRETGVTSITTAPEGTPTNDREHWWILSPEEYTERVLRSLLGQFDLPYLLGGDDATEPDEGMGTR